MLVLSLVRWNYPFLSRPHGLQLRAEVDEKLRAKENKDQKLSMPFSEKRKVSNRKFHTSPLFAIRHYLSKQRLHTIGNSGMPIQRAQGITTTLGICMTHALHIIHTKISWTMKEHRSCYSPYTSSSGKCTLT